MIDPQLVIDRLRSLDLFMVVGGAAEAAAVKDTAAGAGPAAYVVPLANEPTDPRSPGGPQVVVASIGVLVMVRRNGDAKGGVTMNRLRHLQDRLLDGLLGWQPSEQFGPLWWRGGQLQGFDAAALWWLDSYACHTTITPAFPVF